MLVGQGKEWHKELTKVFAISAKELSESNKAEAEDIHVTSFSYEGDRHDIETSPAAYRVIESIYSGEGIWPRTTERNGRKDFLMQLSFDNLNEDGETLAEQLQEIGEKINNTYRGDVEKFVEEYGELEFLDYEPSEYRGEKISMIRESLAAMAVIGVQNQEESIENLWGAEKGIDRLETLNILEKGESGIKPSLRADGEKIEEDARSILDYFKDNYRSIESGIESLDAYDIARIETQLDVPVVEEYMPEKPGRHHI